LPLSSNWDSTTWTSARHSRPQWRSRKHSRSKAQRPTRDNLARARAILSRSPLLADRKLLRLAWM
jgi:hypothetical protein